MTVIPFTDPRPTVVHLVDDTTAGGVMRMLDHMRARPNRRRDAQHVVRPVA